MGQDKSPSQGPALTGSSHAAAGMAVLNVVGGVIGSIVSRKMTSALGGGVLGLAFAWSAHLINSPGETERGLRIGALVSAAMSLSMGRRFITSRKPVPGVLAVAGLASTAYHGLKWKEWTA